MRGPGGGKAAAGSYFQTSNGGAVGDGCGTGVIWAPWEPTLAEAVANVSVAALACFVFLAGLLWLGSIMDRLDRRADASTYSDDDEEGEP